MSTSISEGVTVANVRRDAIGEVLSVWDAFAWVKWNTRVLPMTERLTGLTILPKENI